MDSYPLGGLDYQLGMPKIDSKNRNFETLSGYTLAIKPYEETVLEINLLVKTILLSKKSVFFMLLGLVKTEWLLSDFKSASNLRVVRSL